MIHAIDGLGMGIVILPINDNFILKVYNTEKGEKYADIIKHLFRLYSFLSS